MLLEFQSARLQLESYGDMWKPWQFLKRDPNEYASKTCRAPASTLQKGHWKLLIQEQHRRPA